MTDAFAVTPDQAPLLLDTGLQALAWAARHFDLNISVAQLSHRLGRIEGTADRLDLCRCAGWVGLRARTVHSTAQRLEHLPLPALLETVHGWAVLNSIEEDQVDIYWPLEDRCQTLPREMLRSVWHGQTLLLAERHTGLKPPAFSIAWFLPSILKHLRQFRSVLLVSLMLQLVALVTPMLFENIIDRVLVSRGLSSLQVLGIALLALAIFEPLYGFIRSWLFSNLASKVNAELSARLYQHLVQLPLGYFQQRQTGEIIARVGEMQQIRQFLTGSALTLVLDLAFCGLFIGVMYSYAPTLTWVVVGSLALYFLFWLCVGPLLRSRALREYELGADNTAFLTEAVTGIETIKTGATEGLFQQQWQRQLAAYVRAAFSTRLVGIWAGQGIGLIQKLTSAILLWWGVTLVMDGQITPGQLVAFNMLAGHVVEPILRLAQVWQDFQHTLISLRRLGDILETECESGSGGLASVPALAGSMSFQGVRFRYDEDGQEILRNLNLDIQPGNLSASPAPRVPANRP